MAEERARKRQYEYRATSNLVIQAERDGRRHKEPTGEVESMTKYPDELRMGDRVSKGRSDELSQRIEKSKTKRAAKEQQERKAEKKRRGQAGAQGRLVMSAGATVITETEDMDAMYRPKTKDTAAAYEGVLNFVRRSLGDQPQDILRGAAEEAQCAEKAFKRQKEL